MLVKGKRKVGRMSIMRLKRELIGKKGNKPVRGKTEMDLEG